MNKLNMYEDDDIEIIYWGEEEDNSTVNSEKFKNKRKKERFDWKKDIFDWIKIVIVAVVVALVINNYVIINAEVPTPSMYPTIQKKTRMIGSRLSFVFSEVERGDIIIFKYPDNEKENFVKRVIGLPGETIEIKEGVVYINDEPLNEPYVYYKGGSPYVSGDYKKTLIPKGCYFVLGDNRNDSKDSRFWKTTPYVKKNQIIGRALFTYYPSVSWLS